MSESKATLVDVAKKAGVSLVTSSRALNGTGIVAAKTLAKVKAAAKALGYSPNLSAKMLKGSRTNVLGLLVSDLQSPVLTEIVSAASATVKRAGLDLLIYHASTELGAPDQNNISRLLGGLCDGLLLVLPAAKEGYLADFESGQLPVVLLNYWLHDTPLPTVRADNYEGACAAVAHLTDLGHRRIAFISGTGYSGQSQERQRGYQAALKRAGLKVDKSLIATGDYSPVAGFEVTKRLLKLANPPTAIFAANDLMAFGAMDALKEAGQRIPQDVSVIGFDDIPAASHVFPRLSTVSQPFREISERAVDLLLKQIRAEGEAVKRIELPSKLVIRDSCGPAPTLR